jgi:exosortase D (VPLPA-CTERM-specific)
MAEQRDDKKHITATAAIFSAVAVLYSSVLLKLVADWSSDENYSHGLLIPFVIGLIVWLGWGELRAATKKANPVIGITLIAAALILLFAGTLGAELFTQRISLVLMLAGVVFFMWGGSVIKLLPVPFALLLLSIPIPQIVFNKIAFPLQLLASQAAVRGIRLLDVPTLRKGNVIDILPQGSTQMISLEVVEACSGIRSLMTLITLALILAFFTRNSARGRFLRFERNDAIRAAILMTAAVPIAVLTNSARVTGTGLGTYYYGKQATSPFWHDASGWAVYAIALLLLFAVNIGLKRLLDTPDESNPSPPSSGQMRPARLRPALALTLVLAASGALINWYAFRSEAAPERRPLAELPKTLGDWRQRGEDFKMGEAAERILRASDYTMREYTLPDGRIANIYVGYFASQRTGTTIHSPQNCLPGTGWTMKDPGIVTITPSSGIPFEANRYIIENGIYKEVMLYWYQGRGRTETSEYKAKLDTVVDSVSKRRTDGSMVRVMTTVGHDEAAAERAAIDLAARLADELPRFIPN